MKTVHVLLIGAIALLYLKHGELERKVAIVAATEQQVLDALQGIDDGLTEQETEVRALISELRTANQSPQVNLDAILTRAQGILGRIGTIKRDVSTVTQATGGDTSTSGGTGGSTTDPSSGGGDTSSPGGTGDPGGASGTQGSGDGSA